jgi:hypothetical protein
MSRLMASVMRRPRKPERADECEVRRVGGVAGGDEHGVELLVAQAEGRGLGGDGGAAYVLGRGVFQDAVDDAGAVEARDDRDSSRYGAGGEAVCRTQMVWAKFPRSQSRLRPPSCSTPM